jgi:hypothetical protein
MLCYGHAQPPERNMKMLIEFLSLRPLWTRRGLELVWYVYLAATLLQLAVFVGFSYSAINAANGGYHLSLVYSILFMVAHLALVRIFLELALKFLIDPREEAHVPSALT